MLNQQSNGLISEQLLCNHS